MTLTEALDQIWKTTPAEKPCVAIRLLKDHGDELERILEDERVILQDELSFPAGESEASKTEFLARRMVALPFIRDHMDSKLLWTPEAREEEITAFCANLGVTTQDFWALYKRWNKLDDDDHCS